jgi:phosphatidylethanolamine/phosphatidyl-N-methylethanolamine N-methyltransferase
MTANIMRNPIGGRRFHDACVFLRAWVRDPRRIGSLIPSSNALADLITAEIAQASAPVIELGAGTGVFTRALLTRGVPEDRLVLVEREPNLARILQLQFPTAWIFCLDASRIGRVSQLGTESAGAVVSGLPLLNLSTRTVIAILDSSFRHMRPGAAFYQFTYGLHCPVSRNILDRLGLRAKRLEATIANFPPATVYRIRRRLEHWQDSVGKGNRHPDS